MRRDDETLDEMLKGAFDGVRADEGLKSRTRDAVVARMRAQAAEQAERARATTSADERARVSRPSAAPSAPQRSSARVVRPLWRTLVPLAACLAAVAVLVGFGGYHVYTTPAAAISIDVNPSVELGVNRFDRVVSVDAFNDDGQRLVESLDEDVLNMNYEDAVDCILASDNMQSLLAKGEIISVAVAGEDDMRCDAMLTRLEQCTSEHASGHAYCHRTDANEVEQAHHNGVSFGKYQAILAAQEADPGLTFEQARSMTMRELRAIANGEVDDAAAAGGQGSGTGRGDGAGSSQSQGQGQGQGVGPSDGTGDGAGADGAGRGAHHGAGHHAE